jgi:hypothetical protein
MPAEPEVVAEQAKRLTDALVRAVNESDLPSGAIGRLLFQAFLAVATRAKESQLTVGEITLLCAEETTEAMRLGLLEGS